MCGGVDFAGTVEASGDPRYRPGDKVILTGWRVGEAHWGGYAQRARVKADWLVPLPEGLTTRQAMAIGTPGFTAMLAIMALEAHGMVPNRGPVLVTGAAGGVGSLAVTLLGGLGYEVAALTGRPETEALSAGPRGRPGSCPAPTWPSRSRGRSSPRPGPRRSTTWAARCSRGS